MLLKKEAPGLLAILFKMTGIFSSVRWRKKEDGEAKHKVKLSGYPCKEEIQLGEGPEDGSKGKETLVIPRQWL